MTDLMLVFFFLLLILLIEVQIVAVFSVLAYWQSRPKPEDLWEPTQADVDALEAEKRMTRYSSGNAGIDGAPLSYVEYKERFEELMKQ